jgi:hypothetical protein
MRSLICGSFVNAAVRVSHIVRNENAAVPELTTNKIPALAGALI